MDDQWDDSDGWGEDPVDTGDNDESRAVGPGDSNGLDTDKLHWIFKDSTSPLALAIREAERNAPPDPPRKVLTGSDAWSLWSLGTDASGGPSRR